MALNFSREICGSRDIPSCTERVPNIKRAREYHLYDYQGRRYVDLYLNGGLCLLGHRPPGVFNVMKNTLSRGPAAEYPSTELSRYMKHLATVFPEYRVFRVYASPERALECIRSFLREDNLTVEDPVVDAAGGPARLWRPFAPGMKDVPEVLLPLIPFPSSSAPVTVCFLGGNPPESDVPSPFFVAALSRVLGALEGFGRRYNESLWHSFDITGLWERKGPYLVFHQGEEEYTDLFTGLLEKGVLLPPVMPAVGIVPGEFTAGEIAPIIKAAEERGV